MAHIFTALDALSFSLLVGIIVSYAFIVRLAADLGDQGNRTFTVIPAKAGIQGMKPLTSLQIGPQYGFWTPAFAGVTVV